MILLENGNLYSWGDNTRGNIGHNRSILEIHDVKSEFPRLVEFKE